MELKVVRTRTTETVVTVEKEWSIEANVTMQDGKIENIEGDVIKPECKPVHFSEYRGEDGTRQRDVRGVTADTEGAYALVDAVINAAILKYEGK